MKSCAGVPSPWLAACAALAFVAAAAPMLALAKPPHKAALARHYGGMLSETLNSCHTCHLTDDEIAALGDALDAGESQPWNPFGRRLYELGRAQASAPDGGGRPRPLIERLRLIADDDSDGDGVGNELELLAGTAPGQASERPESDQLARGEQRLREFRQRHATAHAWRPFDPVVRPAPPAVTNAAWVRTPIDAFVAAEHERLGVSPRPEAPQPVLLRRVYLDLIGLPPTPDELHAFLQDDAPDAYERAVDRLLASPRYGERWGRHWMDVWRYSDWAGWGEQVRDSQPHIWRWRDWIVESLNQDKGYDRMVLEMLAADELAPDDDNARRATGFLVRSYKRLSREQWMTEAVDHTSRAFLGLTLKCAQCHDHRYDLVSQEEYYRFRAIFEPYQVRLDPVPGETNPDKNGLACVYDADLDAKTFVYLRGDERTPDKNRPMAPAVPALLGGGQLPIEPVELPVTSYYPSLRPHALEALRAAARGAVEMARAEGEQARGKNDEAAATAADEKRQAAEAEQAALEARIAAEQAKYASPSPPADELQKLRQAASRAERQAALAKARQAQAAAQRQVAAAGAASMPESDKAKKAREEAEKRLAEADKALQTAQAAAEGESETYSPLGPVYPPTSSGRRLALARWIADPHNPLAARVAANHIWARHFGRGLAPTMDDLGQNGREPTHPALLDWLAAELMAPSGIAAPRDAASGGWSMKHLHRVIVTSSAYRTDSTPDSVNLRRDPENISLWRTTPRRVEAEVVRDSVLYVAGQLDLTLGGPELDCKLGLTERRRSLYFRHAPEKQMEFLRLFDMAAPTECYERRESIVPQQALALANSELTIRQARRLARELAEAADPDAEPRVSVAFERVLSRPATAEELATCVDFLGQQTAYFTSRPPDGASTARDTSDTSKPAAAPALRAYENLIHVLLNHHDFVSLR